MTGARSAPCDIARVAAAGLVLVSHARVMLLRDAAAQPDLSIVGRAVFAVSGLGHQAVIVFFVLSGFLVTGGMLRLSAEGRWSLRAFAAARFGRLWAVLVPCLVFGGALDAIGTALVGPGQSYGIPPLGRAVAAPMSLGCTAFLGNLIFLQTIAVPVFGSNGPLWSLANEAWYYAAAGLVMTAACARTPVLVAACVLALAALAWGLPTTLVALAPVWGCGGAAAVLQRRGWPILLSLRWLCGALAVGGVLALLAAARLHHGPGVLTADLGLGVAIAVLLLVLRPAAGGGGPRLAGLARGTYALYVSHVPVLALFAALTVGPDRLVFDARACLLLGAALAVALGAAWGLWWGFERHTGRVQALLREGAAARRPARWREATP